MKIVNMQAHLVEVVKKFSASPGDTLVVVNGVCVGLQEKTSSKAASLTAPTPVIADILAVLPVGAKKSALTIADELQIDRKATATRNVLSRLLLKMVKDGQIKKADTSRLPRYERRVEE